MMLFKDLLPETFSVLLIASLLCMCGIALTHVHARDDDDSSYTTGLCEVSLSIREASADCLRSACKESATGEKKEDCVSVTIESDDSRGKFEVSDKVDLSCVSFKELLGIGEWSVSDRNRGGVDGGGDDGNSSVGCLELLFDAGSYRISADDQTFHLSLVMVAREMGTVEFSCGETETDLTHPEDYVVRDSPLAIVKDGTKAVPKVVLQGLNFGYCRTPLRFDEIFQLTISNCNFRNFTGSAVDIFNSWNVTVEDSMFINNTASSEKSQFRANSGGLSVAYHVTDYTPETDAFQPLVRVARSNFSRNSARQPENLTDTQVNLALNNATFFGRGGGFGLFIVENYTNVTAYIEECVFDENYAISFGGGLYLYIDGTETHHNISLTDCKFYNNTAGTLGGGLQIALLITKLRSPPSSISFYGCEFEGNGAGYGGALSSVQTYSQGDGNFVGLYDTRFVRNTADEIGSAVVFGSYLYVQNSYTTMPYVVRNCQFVDNDSPGGTFDAGFVHVSFEGNNTFENNTGPSLRLVGSLMQVKGTVRFVRNNAEDHEGGALYISSFGQVMMYHNSSLRFVNNTGRIGAAIVVTVQRSSVVFSELVGNPQCFLIHEDPTLPPADWDDVELVFAGNTARVGAAIYVSHMDLCSWYQQLSGEELFRERVVFNSSLFPNWTAFEFENNTNLAHAEQEGDTNRFSVQTEAVRVVSLNDTSTPVEMRPGQTRLLSLIGLDQLNQSTYFIARLTDNRSDALLSAFSQAGDSINQADETTDPDIARIDPGLIPIQPSDPLVSFSYVLPHLKGMVENLRVNEETTIVLDTPYNVRAVKEFSFSLKYLDCLPGYELDSVLEETVYSCVCLDTVYPILLCDEEAGVILLRDGHWMGVEHKPNSSPAVQTFPCPPAYCSCYQGNTTSRDCDTYFYQDDPDKNKQCHSTRQGTLCGECRGNGSHSVGVLRTTCRLCDEEHFYALGFLVVADVVVPLLLLFASVKISLPFPPSLRGLLFYLQTVYYATEYFPASFWDIRKYMLCISSLLGLYFPWDFCLYPGNSALVVHSTYFIPSLLSLACVVGVLLCSKMSRRKVWDGVLSLVLLLYAPLVHTCVSLLFCPALPGEYAHNNSTVPRWFLNAEVRCFSTPLHTFLGLLAIAVLIALTAMSLIFLLLVCCKGHKRLKDKRLIETLTNALRQGYRDQVDWWMAFDLFRRLVFITVLVVLPGRTVAPLYVLMFLLATHLLVQPYKRAWQNAIEAAVLINFTFLLLLRSIQTFLEQQELYFGVSIPLSWSGSLSRVDRLTMMFFVWFYLPLAVGVAMLLSWVPYKIWEFHSSKKKYTVTKTRRRTTRIKTFTTDEWNAVGGSAGKAPSTTVVELTPQPPEGEGEGDLCDDSFEDSYSYSQGSGQGNVSL